ncbi:MAG: aminotransferase class V-fold PLP-dependent enzyme [Bacilli bacterium]|nr:aminotransferase class V-fold PLP-dependent enzyme [Bacilli bacterium]
MKSCSISHKDINLDLKEDFPMLDKDIVYLDSSNTSLTPNYVIDKINEYLKNYEYNYNRGNNDLSFKINNEVNITRRLVAEFINANVEEIIFTSGATSSANIITSDIAFYNLNDNDEILLCNLDHQSTINPWIELQDKFHKFNKNIIINEILIDVYGDYLEDDLISKVNDKTKYVILTHVHNVYGLEMNIKELVKRIKEKNHNTKIVLDASQSIGHIKVDVKDLDIDYMYFSGHKMFATTGIGVLYSKGRDFKEYEKGTPNILGIISLGSAIEYINKIGISNIEDYIYKLTRYLYDQLLNIEKINFNKGISTCKCLLGYGIISFRLNEITSDELNDILNDYKIYVRGSNFCQVGQDNYIRVSLNIYNTKSDVDKLIKVIKHIVNN